MSDKDMALAVPAPGLRPFGAEPAAQSQAEPLVPSAADILACLQWCHSQAGEIMSITAGCASTHGDPGGGLEWSCSLASDIAINLEMLASAMSASGQDPKGLEAKPASAAQSEAAGDAL